MKKTLRFLIFPLSFFLICSSAFAIDISEAMLNRYVAQKLAEKRQKDVQIIDPKVSLLDGYATICATIRSKLLPDAVDFCANMTPQWRQETGSVLATHMSLVSLNAPGVREKDVELLKSIVNQVVLPRLEGTEVYKADNFIGKQVSDLKVLPGRLDISL